MSRARDIASLLNTVATDTELSSEVSTLNTKINQVPTGSKNLLYNGAMQVAQRGTSTAGITTAGYHTADRWFQNANSIGTWTQSIENDAPTGSGLRNSLKILCTTSDASPAAGDVLQLSQFLEGQDMQRIAKGTASAQNLTLSFWVKSNVTGTYVAELRDADNSRTVSASYSVSASATWEKKTITFSADTTGVLDNDNARSFDVNFWLGAGTNFTSGTLATAWASTTSANRAVGQTNLAAATNNYWQITGVQLEVGDTATEFEHLPYGVELARCQRYYIHSIPLDYRYYVQWGYSGTVSTTFPVTMRATPVLAITTNSSVALASITYSATAYGATINLNQTTSHTGVVVHLGSASVSAEL